MFIDLVSLYKHV